jgi:uncharacterized repeat protein (TIGR04042 family)
MPAVRFRVRWPDGGVDTCYSPSTVIEHFFEAGRTYPLVEFLDTCRAGLNAASERVRERYGMACSRAMAQLAAIETTARTQSPKGAVTIESLEPWDARI